MATPYCFKNKMEIINGNLQKSVVCFVNSLRTTSMIGCISTFKSLAVLYFIVGCSNYTITRLNDTTIDMKEDNSNKNTDLIWCQEQCIPPSQGCSFVYKPDKSDCFVYSSCHGNCTTITQSGSILYTITCNGITNVGVFLLYYSLRFRREIS